eukprot:TRINITY_DN8705_c0_g2_i1.p1 TRINITY_DN8705_c0_g2~~TRINITY_DN8705_c0_g2_i1.p1  ORF type:complete len:108 (+),score=18.18 TRINITY_DN8705_c0_g2_i1:254-577(+)
MAEAKDETAYVRLEDMTVSQIHSLVYEELKSGELKSNPKVVSKLKEDLKLRVKDSQPINKSLNKHFTSKTRKAKKMKRAQNYADRSSARQQRRIKQRKRRHSLRKGK